LEARPLPPQPAVLTRNIARVRLACRPRFGAAHAPSPDVHFGHPGLRSLDADCAPASCLRLSATPALGTWAAPHGCSRTYKAMNGARTGVPPASAGGFYSIGRPPRSVTSPHHGIKARSGSDGTPGMNTTSVATPLRPTALPCARKPTEMANGLRCKPGVPQLPTGAFIQTTRSITCPHDRRTTSTSSPASYRRPPAGSASRPAAPARPSRSDEPDHGSGVAASASPEASSRQGR